MNLLSRWAAPSSEQRITLVGNVDAGRWLNGAQLHPLVCPADGPRLRRTLTLVELDKLIAARPDALNSA